MSLQGSLIVLQRGDVFSIDGRRFTVEDVDDSCGEPILIGRYEDPAFEISLSELEEDGWAKVLPRPLRVVDGFKD